jgi:DNA (cytosine-5)-methyltransferase 1
MRPLALDLFCGAGGSAMGLHRAGFDVIGVDNRPQPRYPFPFVQADALAPPFDLSRFDLIWASPPCQAYSAATISHRLAGRAYIDLVEPVRRLLAETGRPSVIENVPGAPIRADFKLDGTMFEGLKVVRERWFECSFWALSPPSGRWPGICIKGGYYSVTGHDGSQSLRKAGGPRNTAAKWREAMGIDWMTRDGLTQAIPPAYSEFIGRAALNYIRAEAP